MRIASLVAAGSFAAACAAGNNSSDVSGSATTAAGGATTTSGMGGNTMSSSSTGIITAAGGSSSTGGGPPSTVYVHTNTTLYQLDPLSPNLALTMIGDFDCIAKTPSQDTSMTDVAVNEQGDLWAISQHFIYSLQVKPGLVHCATTIPLNNAQNVRFYALTFAPVGVLDPNKEVLIAGNTDGELWAVDDKGALTLHGNFGNVPANDGQGHTYSNKNQGQRWELSGDLVFLENNGNPVGFATVRDCPTPPSTTNCGSTDTLIEIDLSKLAMATTQSVTKTVLGQVTQQAGCMASGNAGYGSIFGIAAFNDKVYGFTHLGETITIDNANGQACLVSMDANTKWSGAGVTTIAPVIPPPK